MKPAPAKWDNPELGSPPTRGRGLKQELHPISGLLSTSPPTRGRGLKLDERHLAVEGVQSPPTRGRGLKPLIKQYSRMANKVAPHAGAWIETSLTVQDIALSQSRPPRGGVD